MPQFPAPPVELLTPVLKRTPSILAFSLPPAPRSPPTARRPPPAARPAARAPWLLRSGTGSSARSSSGRSATSVCRTCKVRRPRPPRRGRLHQAWAPLRPPCAPEPVWLACAGLAELRGWGGAWACVCVHASACVHARVCTPFPAVDPHPLLLPPVVREVCTWSLGGGCPGQG